MFIFRRLFMVRKKPMNEGRKKAILDVLKEAMRRETRAFNYYQRASLKAPYPETQSLFLQLAEEERKHRYFLEKELQKIEALLSREADADFIDAEHVAYAVPEEIAFKKLQTAPGVDLAAVSLPTELLGGDYLDTVVLDGEDGSRALGVFLYDVMGHGMDATRLKTVSKKAFGELREAWVKGETAVDMRQSGQVMAAMNRKLVDDCRSCRRFISAFYGVVDPAGKVLMYTSAGHDPPILVKARGEYRHLDETQLLLGVDGDLGYKEVRIPIEVGDVLVLFSDGITEAFNAQEEMFERERLRQTVQEVWRLSPREIVAHIFDVLRDFVKGESIQDEFTLAVMKVVEPQRK